MSLLPFQIEDVVSWNGQIGIVIETRGDRVVVRTVDGMEHITTQDRLRDAQAVCRGAA